MKLYKNIEEMEQGLGDSIRKLRLHKNLDQITVAERGGVSTSAIKNLEGGKGATIKTLLKVLRTLDRGDWIDSLAPVVTVNPLELVRSKQPRQRASKLKKVCRVDPVV